MGVISAWGGVHFIPDAIFLLYIILLFPLAHESCNLLGEFCAEMSESHDLLVKFIYYIKILICFEFLCS